MNTGCLYTIIFSFYFPQGIVNIFPFWNKQYGKIYGYVLISMFINSHLLFIQLVIYISVYKLQEGGELLIICDKLQQVPKQRQNSRVDKAHVNNVNNFIYIYVPECVRKSLC